MKPEYKNILFCSDFSPGADFAFFTALDQAEKYDARLYLVHVVPDMEGYGESGESASGGAESVDEAEVLAKARQRLEDRYVYRVGGRRNYEAVVLRGVPIVEIVRFARDREADLIVMGAAGSSSRNKLHFGSTAENVARRAPCTVMCIRQPRR